MAKTNKATNRLPCIKLLGPRWEHPDNYNESKTENNQDNTSNSQNNNTTIATTTTLTTTTPFIDNHTNNHRRITEQWLAVTLDQNIEQQLQQQIINTL